MATKKPSHNTGIHGHHSVCGADHPKGSPCPKPEALLVCDTPAVPENLPGLRYAIADDRGYQVIRGFAYEEQDARLWAISQDLLVALKAVEKDLTGMTGVGRNIKGKVASLDLARAAIAKAPK